MGMIRQRGEKDDTEYECITLGARALSEQEGVGSSVQVERLT